MIGTVEARVDDGVWLALRPCGDLDWSGPLAGNELAKGAHTLIARAKAADGSRGAQAITFAVDPTGRYTPVPCVCPVVSGTAFC